MVLSLGLIITVYVCMYMGQQHVVYGWHLFPCLVIVVLLSIISNLTSTQITGSKDMSRHHRGVGMCQTLVYSAGFLSWLVFSKCNLTQKSSVHEQILLGLSLTLVWDIYLNIGIKTVVNMYSTLTNHFVGNTWTPAHSCNYPISQSCRCRWKASEWGRMWSRCLWS